MKKRIAMLLTAVMVLTMGMTAFAADAGSGSPSAKPTTITSTTPGITVGRYDGMSNEDYQEWKKEMTTQAANKAASINAGAELVAVENVWYDGVWPGGSITLQAAGVKKGDSIIILHQVYDEKTGEYYWEQIVPSEVGDGYVVAYFSKELGLSPVAIVKLPADGRQDPGKSPKTGCWE